MSVPEYTIVCRVFGDTLPYRFRILITDACGLDGRAFTIPTSLLSSICFTADTFFVGLPLGYLASYVNMAYLINVGDDSNNLIGSARNVLVHKTAHVWQGKNSTFAESFVFNSIYNQCILASAYGYTSGADWHTYNVEQQAAIIEDWYMAGERTDSPLYQYIANNVREGDA